MDLGESSVECGDSAKCYVENNVFSDEMPVSDYSAFDSKGNPVDTTVGFVAMRGNWFTAGGEALKGDAHGYKPDYKVSIDEVGAEMAVRIKNDAGPR